MARKAKAGKDDAAHVGGEGDEGGATELKPKPFRGSRLKGWYKRWASLMEDKRNIDEALRTEVFGVAKAEGYDPKIMKQVFKLREMEDAERSEDLGLLDTYLQALGIGPLFDRPAREDDNEFEPEGDDDARSSPAREMSAELGIGTEH